MAEEIQEAVQIIRLAYDGMEIAIKVGSGGLSAIQKAVDFFKGMLDYEKSIGKTSMRKLLMKGGDLQVFQFRTEDMKKFEKLAKKYGIFYSTLPDINREDGMSEVLFHSEAVPRVNILMQKLGIGKVSNLDDYLKNGSQESPGRLTGELIEKLGLFAIEKQTISVDAVREHFSLERKQAEMVVKQLSTIGVLDVVDENGNYKAVMDKEAFANRIKGYQELTDRIKAVSATKNTSLSDISISKELIVEENERAVKSRVPGTWGENVRYIWLRKEHLLDIYSGKTLLTFLDMNKEYKLYDTENRVVDIIKGDILYSKHYDKVDAAVRDRYENKRNSVREAVKSIESLTDRKR